MPKEIIILSVMLASATIVYLVSRGILSWKRKLESARKGSPQTNDPQITDLLSELVPLEKRHEELDALDPTDNDVFVERGRASRDIRRLLGALCERYLKSDSEVRSQIRRFFGNRSVLSHFLLIELAVAARELGRTADPEILRKGLAAASIENNRRDFRDTYHLLGHLYLAAQRVGISTRRYFEEAGALSDTLGVYAEPSMKDILSHFEQLPIFNELLEAANQQPDSFDALSWYLDGFDQWNKQ